ncbi:hypothetical protein Tsubulata_012713 [Turnera subulata]|uniref:Uncharacterized protein n=1 Tax=Turnera subulata TaxID=218843 RepID=A0A9Q0GFA7_9ROSI|nr:hypothetical protein Tsubulata_012713 [Turnera subulata]
MLEKYLVESRASSCMKSWGSFLGRNPIAIDPVQTNPQKRTMIRDLLTSTCKVDIISRPFPLGNSAYPPAIVSKHINLVIQTKPATKVDSWRCCPGILVGDHLHQWP